MIDDLARIADEARARIAEATTVEALDEVVRSTLGKKGSLKVFKRELVRLDPDERRSVGQAVNDVIDAPQAAADDRRRALERGTRVEHVQADSLDPPEVQPGPRAGHSPLGPKPYTDHADTSGNPRGV